MENIKTGQQVIEEFFNDLINISDVDEKTALVIQTLHKNDKLTSKNIENELRKIREEGASDKT